MNIPLLERLDGAHRQPLGLGLVTGRRLVDVGGRVVIADLLTSAGDRVAKELGDAARFVAADITDPEQVEAVLFAGLFHGQHITGACL